MIPIRQRRETTSGVQSGGHEEAAALHEQELLETYLAKQESIIPQEWEVEPQMLLEGFDPQNAAENDTKAYCQFLLGDLSSRYRVLRKQAERVREAVESDGMAGHHAMMDGDTINGEEQARRHALEALTNWFYKDGQNEKETASYIGAVGCSEVTVGAIKELNRQKQGFKLALGRLRESLHHGQATCGTLYEIVSHIAPNALPNVERRYAGSLVRRLIHTRLNIRQLVRQIPVIGAAPGTIRWRWVETPTTLKLKRKDVLDLLDQKADNPIARMDYERVAGVSDQFFCWRKGSSYDCRIFAKCGAKGKGSGVKYVNFKSRVPVFYLQPSVGGEFLTPKMTIVPDKTEPMSREKRVDPEVFLDTMAIHRYLKQELQDA